MNLRICSTLLCVHWTTTLFCQQLMLRLDRPIMANWTSADYISWVLTQQVHFNEKVIPMDIWHAHQLCVTYVSDKHIHISLNSTDFKFLKGKKIGSPNFRRRLPFLPRSKIDLFRRETKLEMMISSEAEIWLHRLDGFSDLFDNSALLVHSALVSPEFPISYLQLAP